MPTAPTGDGCFYVLEVPLQRAPSLGAAPAAEVLSWFQHPPQPQLAEGFATHVQHFAGVGGADKKTADGLSLLG